MSKYNVGDKVKIREDLVVGKRYGSELFVENMVELKGKEVTIESAYDYSEEYSEEYRIEELGFTWTDEMIEGLVKEVKPNFKLEDEVELISVDDYNKIFGLKIGNKGVIIDISKHSDTCIVRFHNGIISMPIYFHQIKLVEEPSQSIPNKGTIKYITTDDGTTYATLNGSSLGKSVKGGKDEADNKIGILIATARSLGFDEDKIGGIVDVLFDDDSYDSKAKCENAVMKNDIVRALSMLDKYKEE